MWDLALMNISYKSLILCELFIFSQYGIGVLQTPPFKPLTSLTSCSVLMPYDRALLGGSDTICNDPEKNASHICAITPK
jgi:hypothetical protein